MRFSTLLSATTLFELGLASYTLEDDYMKDSYGSFNFFTGTDPTDGFVKFVDQATARSTGLISSKSSKAAQWGVDTTNKTPGGRPAVRLESKKTYNNGLIVLDVAHMPFGRGTWPAFWTVGPNWPSNGEIDIIEGVHKQATDAMTLHTGPGCTIGKGTTAFAGNLSTPNCDIHAYGQAENQGCGIKSADTKSYGAGLNANKGGVYATEWTAQAISIYFFPRGAIPADVLGDNPNPSGWGKPAAKFTGGCDIPTMFKNHQIVFDTTFCGQWAGTAWPNSTCANKAATCNDYVRDNPQAFTEAYWEINALKVYQSNGQSSNSTQPPPPGKSTAMSQPIAQPTKSAAPVPAYSVASKPTSKTAAIPAIPSSKAAVAPSAPSSKPVPGYGAPESSSKSIYAAPSAQAAKGQNGAQSAAPVAAPSAAVPSGAAPASANGMPGFQWPKTGAGQTQNQTRSYAASPPKSTGATVSSAATDNLPHASGTAMSGAPRPKPTNGNSSSPAIPYVAEVTKTVEKTVYVTDDAAVATPPVSNVKMARFIKEHKRDLTRHHYRHWAMR